MKSTECFMTGLLMRLTGKEIHLATIRGNAV